MKLSVSARPRRFLGTRPHRGLRVVAIAAIAGVVVAGSTACAGFGNRNIKAWLIRYEALVVSGQIASVSTVVNPEGKDAVTQTIDAPISPWSAAVTVMKGTTPKITVTPVGDGQVRCRIVLDNTTAVSDVASAPGRPVTCEATLPATFDETPSTAVPSTQAP